MTSTPPDQLPVPERAMGIGAHPDDIEFGAGGTLAKWAAAGTEVTMVIVTDGSKGTWDRGMDPHLLSAIRKDEALAAAKELGAARVIHLDHVDGELQYTMNLRAQICLQIRLQRPDVLLGHDPWQRYQLHPDHRVAGLATVDGVVAARDHLFFPDQGVAPHRPSALLLFAADQPDHWEDVDGWLPAKTAALLRHSSQGATTMDGAHEDEDRAAAFRDRVVRRSTDVGGPVGLAAAEAFKLIRP